jgi:hypothetical protein
LTSDGHVLSLGYPIDDPVPAEKIELRPNQTLTGTYHLSSMLIREKVPPDSNIAIVWAYRLPAGPKDGKDSGTISTGVAVLHTPK